MWRFLQQFDSLLGVLARSGLFIFRLAGGPMSEPQHGSLLKKKFLIMQIWATALPTIILSLSLTPSASVIMGPGGIVADS